MAPHVSWQRSHMWHSKAGGSTGISNGDVAMSNSCVGHKEQLDEDA